MSGVSMELGKILWVNSLQYAYVRHSIKANIPRNRRSANWQTDDDTPLDPELYRGRLVIECLNAWLDGSARTL